MEEQLLLDLVFDEIPTMTDEQCRLYDEEQWADIDGCLSVSSYGNYFLKNGKYTIIPHKDNGYLYYRGKPLSKYIAEVFIPNPKNLSIVDHINGNRMDNSVSNLRWVSKKKNLQNKHNLGYSKKGNMEDILDRYYKRRKQKKVDKLFEECGDLFPELPRTDKDYYKRTNYKTLDPSRNNKTDINQYIFVYLE